MKKISLLVVVLISVFMTSCQNDDGNSEPMQAQDEFIGTWKLTKEVMDGVQQSLTTCDLETNYEVTSDLKFTLNDYIKDGSNCMIDTSTNGTWENLGNGTYKITPDEEGARIIEGKITFSGNTMIFDQSNTEEKFIQHFAKN